MTNINPNTNPNPNNNYFFCYSTNLYKQLKSQNLYYITKGTNPSTNKMFWVFEKTDQLKQILNTWSSNKLLLQSINKQ